MKLNGMSAAIDGPCIDTKIMLSAMTNAEKQRLIEAAQQSIEDFERMAAANRKEVQ